MQRKDARVFDKGPASFGLVDELRGSDSDEVYVFANKPLSTGTTSIPALEFVRVKRAKVERFKSAARRKNADITVCPPGWEPE